MSKKNTEEKEGVKPREELKVMIVDDDPNVLSLAKIMLKHAGFEKIVATNNSFSALKKMQHGLVDIALLDWKIPNLSGLDVLKTIRAHDIILPIIMLTSHSDQEHVVEAIKAGATDYIIKPFNQKILVSKIQSGLEKALKEKEERELAKI